MTGEPPPGAPEFDAAPEPAPQPAHERYPFWGFPDVLLFTGLALPCMICGVVAMKTLEWAFRWQPRVKAMELLPAQFLGYGFLFLTLFLLFRVQYGRPFWKSLAWRDMKLAPGWVISMGVVVSLIVAVGGALLRIPDTDTPMKQLLADPRSVLLVAAAGITLGPLCEELIFRGFLQPLLVRAAGRVAGILLAAVPFGLLHLQQYGFSWRHAVLICFAGACFGWMRERTGSTKASTLMHAAYNSVFFLGLLAQRKDLPHIW